MAFCRTSKVLCHLDKLGNLQWSRGGSAQCVASKKPLCLFRPQFVICEVRALMPSEVSVLTFMNLLSLSTLSSRSFWSHFLSQSPQARDINLEDLQGKRG